MRNECIRASDDWIWNGRAAIIPVDDVVEKQSSTEQREETIKKKNGTGLREKEDLKPILRKSTDNESVMKKVTYADAVKSTMWE